MYGFQTPHNSFRVLFRRTLKSCLRRCVKQVLFMVCHRLGRCYASCLRVVRSRVDDETNESLPTLCQASWPRN